MPEVSGPRVTSELRGPAAIVRFANPPRGTMTAAGAALMAVAVEKALGMASVRAVILTGATPGMFVRHYEVAEIVASGEAMQRPQATAASGIGPFAELLDLVATAPRPVIAAINGMCMGGGFELTLACDLRIAGTDVAQIGLPEVRVGIVPGAGGTQRLPRLIGEAKALHFILEGAVVDAARALELGLVHALADDPVAEAQLWAGRMAEKPAGGLAAAKRLVRSALDRPISDGLAEERRAFAALIRDDPEATAAMKEALARPIAE